MPVWAAELKNPPAHKSKQASIPDLPGFPSFAVLKKDAKEPKAAQRKPPTPDEMDTWKLKKAWEVALGPIKSLPMTAIMMYMSGNSLQIFSLKLAYVVMQLVALALGIWKVNSMGLLPTTRSDWLAWEMSEPARPGVAGRPTEIRIHQLDAQLPPKTGLLIRRTLPQYNILNTTIDSSSIATTAFAICGAVITAHPRWLRVDHERILTVYAILQMILTSSMIVTGGYLADNVHGFQTSFEKFGANDRIPYYSMMYYGPHSSLLVLAIVAEVVLN
ncbi:b27284f9-0714-4c07-898b-ca257c1f4914 [Thermothielavioides terrestris]|uniref:ER membrane protein complex subunit 4 n=1 Tax=Thermothielavioides terrestris TaxID=2587410 RepID=A0A446BKI8_9PEZI|nr:b27284f9-0714-4c07-898b-ca257c1f4914 [Thermothielavioides terrestris]